MLDLFIDKAKLVVYLRIDYFNSNSLSKVNVDTLNEIESTVIIDKPNDFCFNIVITEKYICSNPYY